VVSAELTVAWWTSELLYFEQQLESGWWPLIFVTKRESVITKMYYLR